MNQPDTLNDPLNELLQGTPQLWKGRQRSRCQNTLATGHARLDSRLPGQGWPVGAVTELISLHPGLGEFSLLFPALAELAQQGQWVVLADPPWVPYPASLQGHGLPLERLMVIRTRADKESLWAIEQALRSGRGGAVLAWPGQVSFARMRRLQLAAESQGKLAFLFRPESATTASSPAALRLQLAYEASRGTRIDILKCRGARPSEPFWLRRHPESATFSRNENQQCNTQGHASLAQKHHDALLAGASLPAPGPGPVHPQPGPAKTAPGRKWLDS